MPDREKVIKGLGRCLTLDSPCGDCPYYSYEDIQELDCERNLRHDAIALLKEQEAERLLKGDPKSFAGFIETCDVETLLNFLKGRLVSFKSFSISDEGRIYFEGILK